MNNVPLPGFEFEGDSVSKDPQQPVVNVMEPTEFREEGYLQELNRLFLHPLGLALAVDVDTPTDDDGYFRVQVWDYRYDPEGFFFAPGVINPEHVAKISSEADAKRDVREAVAEDMIQNPYVELVWDEPGTEYVVTFVDGAYPAKVFGRKVDAAAYKAEHEHGKFAAVIRREVRD